jgi:hypothetical protein
VQQERFILALEAMGSVAPALKAIGMGRHRMFDYAMERAINGVTTVRVLRGGSISVACGPDMKLVQSSFRDAGPVANKATKETLSG